jgi:hypothetical protein
MSDTYQNYGKCNICQKEKILTHHHLFSQTKINKKLYGELIHRKDNIILICLDCHLTKALPKLSEQEFCDLLGIEVRSKTRKL